HEFEPDHRDAVRRMFISFLGQDNLGIIVVVIRATFRKKMLRNRNFYNVILYTEYPIMRLQKYFFYSMKNKNRVTKKWREGWSGIENLIVILYMWRDDTCFTSSARILDYFTALDLLRSHVSELNTTAISVTRYMTFGI
ncbi:hypothetical protein ACJX0J_015504, partial [Zea mays]